ncbi:molybdopterin-dependent oxidoreductase [Streptomyces europaeiscabiei]|uniref:Molybdopterin-dependent oxidoreductase n=1 Tax=Streptomyces europaeiscabiei TaxID=146819 RepID=A0AAJ2UKT7_9ACTN|nr:molybdopterin-dependent oxidoreductase [Streptomyces europaeiscabiei]MDX3129931.1 molybdopterin-dependent oxidoreductase [Streptomyces europaeiscabiei]
MAHYSTRVRRTPVTGARMLGGLVPCNVIAEEILTDLPKRFRAMVIESSNPAHSLADSATFREALAALELVVVIDVAHTETGRLADYVLPAASQFEKWEATFFNMEFPRNNFHLRAPVLDQLPGTLTEPEIHARLIRELDIDPATDIAIHCVRARRMRWSDSSATRLPAPAHRGLDRTPWAGGADRSSGPW